MPPSDLHGAFADAILAEARRCAVHRVPSVVRVFMGVHPDGRLCLQVGTEPVARIARELRSMGARTVARLLEDRVANFERAQVQALLLDPDGGVRLETIEVKP